MQIQEKLCDKKAGFFQIENLRVAITKSEGF
jgi:hypothetical protein